MEGDVLTLNFVTEGGVSKYLGFCLTSFMNGLEAGQILFKAMECIFYVDQFHPFLGKLEHLKKPKTKWKN